MPPTQIAFDFGELPKKPSPEKIMVPDTDQPVPEEIIVEETVLTETILEETILEETILEEEVLEVSIPEPRRGIGQRVSEAPSSPVLIEVKEKSTRGRKSLKEMSAGVELIEVPEDAVLYQKMYYSIGSVAAMFKVNQSLIRLWENEFDVLKPKKNGKGDRLFRPEDIKNIHLIYHLMRERKYTMEGAKDFIKKNKKANQQFEMIASLKKLRGFLVELKASL